MWQYFRSDDLVRVELVRDRIPEGNGAGKGFAFLLYDGPTTAAKFLGFCLQSGIAVCIDGKSCILSYAHSSAFCSMGQGKEEEYWDEDAVLDICDQNTIASRAGKRSHSPAPRDEETGKRARLEFSSVEELTNAYLDIPGKCCLLCKRKFRFVDTLQRHFNGESEMHRENVDRVLQK